jgi:hypothetical protein
LSDIASSTHAASVRDPRKPSLLLRDYASRHSGPARGKHCHFCRAALSIGVFEIPVHDTNGYCGLLMGEFMSNRLFRTAGLFAVVLLLVTPARAQSPSPDALAAAKELVTTMNLAEQFKALMPMIMKNLKPAIVQGRNDVDRDYEAMAPILLEGFQARMGELSEAVAIIYSSNFSADDLRAVSAFYKTPAGRKLLEKTPFVAQQTMAAGQKFGQSVAADMQKRIIEELRKKGHSL